MKIRKHKNFLIGCLAVYLVFFISCSKSSNSMSLTGTWRAVLESPGGELPFALEIVESDDGTIKAHAINGEERISFSSVVRSGNNIKLEIEHYDSIIEGTLDATGKRIDGVWSKWSTNESRTSMDFFAEMTDEYRFKPVNGELNSNTSLKDVSGEWKVNFVEGAENTPALGIFEQKGSKVTGTFITGTGDYRFLEGTFENGLLRLSCFDGAHAFLFQASAKEDGSLEGDFWFWNTYSGQWTGTREEAELPDPFTIIKTKEENQKFTFQFPDVEGNEITEQESRFKDKALLVYIFGTWCANSNDATQLYTELYKKYRDRGLEIIGFSNEYSGDIEKNIELLKRYTKRHDIEWTQLLVGKAIKRNTASAFPALDGFGAYPTTIFVDKSGYIREIFSGFLGPATGQKYEDLKTDFNRIIEEMLRK